MHLIKILSLTVQSKSTADLQYATFIQVVSVISLYNICLWAWVGELFARASTRGIPPLKALSFETHIPKERCRLLAECQNLVQRKKFMTSSQAKQNSITYQHQRSSTFSLPQCAFVMAISIRCRNELIQLMHSNTVP